MSEFEKINPSLAQLFLRLDAAMPTDPVLLAAAEAWGVSRGGTLLPELSLLHDLPSVIRPHVFLMQAMPNGQRAWVFSGAGASARVSLGGESGRLMDIPDKALARRLQALFDLVVQKGEPCSGMFELQAPGNGTRFCEAYAAPVAPPRRDEAALLAVLNCRAEAIR